MLLRPFVLMVLMAVLCGTSLVPLRSHNFSMPALCRAWWGYLKADERNRLQSILSKAIKYTVISHAPSAVQNLHPLRIQRRCWWTTMFFSSGITPTMSSIAFSPNLKILITIFANVLTILLCLWTSVLFNSKQNFVYTMLFRETSTEFA